MANAATTINQAEATTTIRVAETAMVAGAAEIETTQMETAFVDQDDTTESADGASLHMPDQSPLHTPYQTPPETPYLSPPHTPPQSPRPALGVFTTEPLGRRQSFPMRLNISKAPTSTRSKLRVVFAYECNTPGVAESQLECLCTRMQNITLSDSKKFAGLSSTLSRDGKTITVSGFAPLEIDTFKHGNVDFEEPHYIITGAANDMDWIDTVLSTTVCYADPGHLLVSMNCQSIDWNSDNASLTLSIDLKAKRGRFTRSVDGSPTSPASPAAGPHKTRLRRLTSFLDRQMGTLR